MRCNVPKTKPLSITDRIKIQDAICNIRCCKCGTVIRNMTEIYALTRFNKKQYDKHLCNHCSGIVSGNKE